MAIEIKAPESLKPLNNKNIVKIFLGGTIDMGNSQDWQTKLTKDLKDCNVIIANPRRKEWDSTWVQSIDNPQFREQVEWELSAMDMCNTILIYLEKDSKSPISLLEIGLHAHDKKLIVVCENGFYRKGNIDIVCNKYKIAQMKSLNEFVVGIKKFLDMDDGKI